jgi:imidazolonepropionase-like amidohydrolase
MRKIFITLGMIVWVASCTDGQQLSEEAHYNWLHMQGNLLAQEKLLKLSEAEAMDTLFVNVNIVDVANGRIRKNASVLVRDGKVEWIRDDEPAIDNVLVVDGAGKFLSPGLTDMHVHTHDDADYLLHLAHGVTSIREMNGWGWRLKRRETMASGKLLVPNMYITSQILNTSDFGGYAIPLDTVEEARAAVRQAADTGYDAIKIHNGLSRDQFVAIMEESKSIGLKVVGHIPVRVSVSDAITNGMHTAEHFKGYIDDQYLEISEDDWLSPSVGMATYLTPTFYSYREHLRGKDAERVIREDATKVLPHRKITWQPYVVEKEDEILALRQNIRKMSEEIFKALLPYKVKWLAGTDSGGYELMVPGEALIEELEIMEGLGLSTADTLRSATTTAAEAMGWQNRTGQIAPGMSADLILLEKNPLETVANLRTIVAVMIRGIWLPEPEKLPFTGADIGLSKRVPSRDELAAMVSLAEAHDAAGYAQSTMSLALWIALAEDLGERELASRLRMTTVH